MNLVEHARERVIINICFCLIALRLLPAVVTDDCMCVYCADDLSVVKCLVQLTLTVTRHHSSAVELCRDIARDLHICVGDIDQVIYYTAFVAAAASAACRPIFTKFGTHCSKFGEDHSINDVTVFSGDTDARTSDGSK